MQHRYDVISVLISMKTSIMQDQPADALCSVCFTCLMPEGCHKCHCAAQIQGGGGGDTRRDFFAVGYFARNFPHNFQAAVQNKPAGKFSKMSCPTVACACLSVVLFHKSWNREVLPSESVMGDLVIVHFSSL